MTTECKRVLYAHDIFCVLMVLVSKSLQYFNFYFALFVQFLPIFQYLQRNHFFTLVVEASDHHSESTFTQFLLDLISIIYLFFGFIQIIGLVIVETVIVN